MTIPAFTGLETAYRGLEAMQAAIDTTGNNISNANTAGYTRESVDFEESPALTLPAYSNVTGAGVQLGTGVDASTISRIRDQFLDVQYRAQNSASSNASTQSSQLNDVQTAVNEPSSSGISAAMSSFWSAWGSLAQSPSNPAAQQGVVEAGQTLAQTFNSVDQQMAAVQSQAGTQLSSLTASGGELDQYASQIASLNKQITQSTQAGESPNSLLDQRDNLLDKLSALGTVSISGSDAVASGSGAFTVTFGAVATPLVQGSAENLPTVAALTPTPPTSPNSQPGGQLGALMNLSSSTGPIGTLRSSLNGVAAQVASAVNGLQPASSPFFSGTTAGTITVAATASTITASSPTGSGDVASSIAALSGGAPDQSFAAFVGQVGTAVSSASNAAATGASVLGAINNQRESVSGVSLDEEMSNLITFQQGYQASARMMSTINSVLNTLINQTGAGL